MNFPQLPGADPGGTGVNAPGGLPLGAQVLGDNGHALAADALHHGCGHLPGKVGVLAEAFFTPAPPGVPEHIQGGDQGQVDAHGGKLSAADLGGFPYQLRAEGGSRCQIDGEKPAVQGLMAVGTFGAQEHRDPQPGVGNDIFLHLIRGPGGKHAVQAGFEGAPGPGVRPVQAVQGTQAGVSGNLLPEFIGEGDRITLPGKAPEAIEPLAQLADLFLQGHPGKQILRPHFRGKGWILIGIHRILR